MKRIALAIVLLFGLTVAVTTWADGPQPAVGLYYTKSSDPTAGTGMTAPLWQLLIRTDTPSLYYKSGSTNTAWTRIGTGTGGGGSGTVTSVACGTGLSCTPSPITTTGTIGVNLTPTTCTAGRAETATASDGTGTCSVFVNAAGTGLSLTGSSLAVNIAGASCSAGQAVTSIGATGTGTCSSVGTVTSSTLTANTIVKATGAAALANSNATDNGTTYAVNEAFSTTGTTTLGDATHDTTIGRNLVSTAGTTSVGQFTGTLIAPTALTGTVNDWAPTGLATAANIQVALSGATTLTGLSGGVSGRQICLWNSGAFNLSISNNSGSSAAANRIVMASGAALTLGASLNEWACFIYDGVNSLWRNVVSDHLVSLNVSGSSTLATTVTGALTSTSLITNGATAHWRTTGTAPALTACGTSPAITGTDIAGHFTTGSVTTTCTATFAGTYGIEPMCMIQAANGGTAPACVITATAITCGTVVPSTEYYYHCIGLN